MGSNLGQRFMSELNLSHSKFSDLIQIFQNKLYSQKCYDPLTGKQSI